MVEYLCDNVAAERKECGIDPRKLRDYALDFSHDTGQYKAAFFAQMGYVAKGVATTGARHWRSTLESAS